MEDRDIIIERLYRDLIGPYEENEVLDSRPSDVYLSGILWPRQTTMSIEDNEKLSLSGITGDDITSGQNDEEVSITGMNRPSSAGISFAVYSPNNKPTIIVKVNFALYEHNKIIKEKDIKEKSKKYHIEWKRIPYEIDVKDIQIDKNVIPWIDLHNYGAPENIKLHLRVAKWYDKWLVTVTIVNENENMKALGRTGMESNTLFQVKLKILPENDTLLVARPPRSINLHNADNEDLSSALLFRNVDEFAVGHTCSAEWVIGKEKGTTESLSTTWIPITIVPATSAEGHKVFEILKKSEDIQPLSALWLSYATDDKLRLALSEITEAYADWIKIQEKKIGSLSGEYKKQAQINLDICKHVNERMIEGINQISNNSKMAESFRLANRAMLLQYSWDQEKIKNGPLIWRPFQLGFILLAISSTADRYHPDRNTMDLLWFPTGGGKTEAYLALIAFTSFYRRISSKNADDGAGVTAIMRYTLRLLTTQQFTRASAMVLACEAIRRGHVESKYNSKNLGNTPFSIGLWVGGDATPNTYEDACMSLDGSTDLPSPQQLATCPACGKMLIWYVDKEKRAISVRCDNTECLLYDSHIPLPVYTVDSDIYRERPTLLIGTIDKFAQIVRRKEINNLFNITKGVPPDLIIQDELHLISGPLGTIAGVYETALDQLFTRDSKIPKIIGSTATIRRANEQVKALFNRNTCQFPPPAIDANDSGFAVPNPKLPGRMYAGVTTAGRSAKYTLQGVSASLLQSSNSNELSNKTRDHYWTLVSYFNSLRELGGALVLMQDDVNDTISIISSRRKNVFKTDDSLRIPKQIEELTSRRTQLEVRDMLNSLNKTYQDQDALDVVLATNMLSVGVDIPRLGLMLVNGQPKGISEYIQATSRIGRGKVPGLVVSVLNNAKARDRSHYESFNTWHYTLYRDVEASSVTPFASRARDRALHAVLVSLIRHQIPGMLEKPILEDIDNSKIDEIIEYITARAIDIDPEESSVKIELIELLNEWKVRDPLYYWDSYRPKDSLLQDAERAATKRAMGYLPGDAWKTMNNMRSVEPSVKFRLTEILSDFKIRGGQNAQ